MLVLLSSVSLLAQRPGGGAPPSAEERAERTVTRMNEKMDINDEQKTELTAIFKTFYEDVMANRGDWEKMRELATTRDEKVKAVLADDAKYEAYTEFLKEHRQKARRGGGRKQGKGKH